jgi:DNA primase large subunit
LKTQDADPLKVKIKDFYPKAEPEEARELLLQALDQSKTESKKDTQKKEYEEVKIKDLSPELYPPCISKILEGLVDGRKRALFILMNFFRNLGQEWDEIEKRIDDWNKKNKKPLKSGYIKSQFNWARRNKQILPPNCDKDHYKGIGVCLPDNFCGKIKNPVNYTVRKSRFRKKTKRKK